MPHRVRAALEKSSRGVPAAGEITSRAIWARAIYTGASYRYIFSGAMGRTFHRYILFEVLAPFSGGLALFTFILLIARIMRLVELIVNRGVPFEQILLLFSYILPAFLEVTVPMALLLGVILAVGRLSSDSEIIAMRASGVSLYQIAQPIVALALIVCAGSFMLSLHARPWGNAALKAGIFELARTRATAGLKEQVFNDDFAGLVIYSEEIEPPGTQLKRILISDHRAGGAANTVIAQRGEILADQAAQTLNLRLFDGTIFTNAPKRQTYERTDFKIYDVLLDLGEALGNLPSRQIAANEMPLAKLRERIRTQQAAGDPATRERVEFQRRLAVPCAALIFALLGIPLGLQPVRAVRSRGMAVSLGVILVYYLLLGSAEALAQNGRVPIVAAIWMPNALLGLTGAILFRRAAQENVRNSGSLIDQLRQRLDRGRKNGGGA
jgi:lipopolysaccharide export system permease protein